MNGALLKSSPNKIEESQHDISKPSKQISEDLVRQFKGTLQKQRIMSYLSQPAINVSSVVLSEDIFWGTAAFEEPGKVPVPTVTSSVITQNQFITLQKWQGAVVEVKKDTFLAKLTDLIETGVEEEAEFPLEEVSDDDKELVVPGGVFYWNIGYQTSNQGQQTRVSIIRFRRLPVWRKEELDAAKSRAQKLRDFINWK